VLDAIHEQGVDIHSIYLNLRIAVVLRMSRGWIKDSRTLCAH